MIGVIVAMEGALAAAGMLVASAGTGLLAYVGATLFGAC